MTDKEKIKQLEELIINLQLRIELLENRQPEIKQVPVYPQIQPWPMTITSTTSTSPTYTINTGGLQGMQLYV